MKTTANFRLENMATCPDFKNQLALRFKNYENCYNRAKDSNEQLALQENFWQEIESLIAVLKAKLQTKHKSQFGLQWLYSIVFQNDKSEQSQLKTLNQIAELTDCLKAYEIILGKIYNFSEITQFNLPKLNMLKSKHWYKIDNNFALFGFYLLFAIPLLHHLNTFFQNYAKQWDINSTIEQKIIFFVLLLLVTLIYVIPNLYKIKKTGLQYEILKKSLKKENKF